MMHIIMPISMHSMPRGQVSLRFLTITRLSQVSWRFPSFFGAISGSVHGSPESLRCSGRIWAGCALTPTQLEGSSSGTVALR